MDIFCEEGAFPLDVSRYYLEQAHNMGFGLKIHAEQLHDLGGCEMAAALGATSVDHCDYLTPAAAARIAPRTQGQHRGRAAAAGAAVSAAGHSTRPAARLSTTACPWP